MVKICLETAASNPQGLESVVLYFELWLLRLGGYLPDWNICGNCRRQIGVAEKANLQMSFELLCQNCGTAKSKFVVSPEQREIFNTAQKIAPDKFIKFTDGKLGSVKEVSAILRRIISSILGKDTISEKVLVVGREG